VSFLSFEAFICFLHQCFTRIAYADGSNNSSYSVGRNGSSQDLLAGHMGDYIQPTNIQSALDNMILWSNAVLQGLEQIRWKPIGYQQSITGASEQPLYSINNPQEVINDIVGQYAHFVKGSLQFVATVAEDYNHSNSHNSFEVGSYMMSSGHSDMHSNAYAQYGAGTKTAHSPASVLPLTRGVTADAMEGLLDQDFFAKYPSLNRTASEANITGDGSDPLVAFRVDDSLMNPVLPAPVMANTKTPKQLKTGKHLYGSSGHATTSSSHSSSHSGHSSHSNHSNGNSSARSDAENDIDKSWLMPPNLNRDTSLFDAPKLNRNHSLFLESVFGESFGPTTTITQANTNANSKLQLSKRSISSSNLETVPNVNGVIDFNSVLNRVRELD
jgi:hypothetical protein